LIRSAASRTSPRATSNGGDEPAGAAAGSMPLLALAPRPFPLSPPGPLPLPGTAALGNGAAGGGYGATLPSASSSSITSSSTTPKLGSNYRPRFLVLDFTHVASTDATAVHSCFAPVARLSQTLEVP
jgi:hypothetical protein